VGGEEKENMLKWLRTSSSGVSVFHDAIYLSQVLSCGATAASLLRHFRLSEA
jgi:hypothetical protein